MTKKLYFDDTCPICTKEMCKLRALKDQHLELVPISELTPDTAPSIPKDKLFQELHIQEQDGTWITGLDANIEAWQHTRYRSVAGILKWPLLYQIATLGYALWLKWYQRQRAKRLNQTSNSP